MKTVVDMAIVKTALLGVAGLAMAGSAWADCGGSTYCSSSKTSYHDGGYSSIGAVDYSSSTYGGGETVVYGSGGSYTSGLGASTVVSNYSSSTYSSGATGISAPYTLSTDVSHSGTISGLSVPGLGAGEQLCPTSCGSSGVAGGGKVLGCYAVCKPAPQPVTTTVLTQVVRPVYYVRYPVPYAVPVVTGGYGYDVHYSRYGDHAHRGGFAPNCSYDYGYHGHAGGYGYGGSYGYGCR